MALPELKRRGYDERMASARCAAPARWACCIPPSIIMIVYAVAAEVSILKMFIAGVLPGILLIALFSGYIVVWALLNPDKTPRATRQRCRCSRSCAARGSLIPCMLLIVFVMAVDVHRLGDRDGSRGIRRARRARHRLVERLAHLRELLATA